MEKVKKWEELPELLTTRELQEILPIGRNSLYAVLHSSDFPVRRVGRKFIVSKQALKHWLEEKQ